MDQRIQLEKIYVEYKELVQKTLIPVQDLKPSKKLSVKYIRAADLLRKEELRRKLLAGKQYLELKPREWFEIENG